MAKELDVKVETTDFSLVAKKLAETLGPGNKARNVFNIHMKASFKAAMKKPAKVLKEETKKGPTGNLKKSVQAVVREYKKNRKWFGAVGYSASGSKTKIAKAGYRTGANLGYHQGLVEFGTKARRSEGRIASSISRFTSVTVSNARDGSIRTKPKMPKGFFKTAKAGQTVDLGQMRPQRTIPRVWLTAKEYINAGIREDFDPSDATKKGRVQKAFDQLNYVSNKLKSR